ncbi:MAG: WYL domain-containing protein [Colwellia sp.]
MDDINQSQKERLSHIDFRLYFLGSIGRNDLVQRFGIKEAAATRDISLYRELASANLSYDTKAKIYVVADGFTPLFSYRPDRALSALSLGFGDDIVADHKPFISCETPSQLNKPDINVLAKLTRAIYNKCPITIEYRSLSSGLTKRDIVPFSLVDNGLRWHVRAYDRRRGRFTDFVITRITNPALLSESVVEEHEQKMADNQWNRIVELEVVAHPTLDHKETIEADYGMIDQVLEINVRAAVAGYLLRRWNVDCSAGATLNGAEYHLWLRNRQALYGVNNLVVAPGFEQDPL